jgi:hypothetical protein
VKHDARPKCAKRLSASAESREKRRSLKRGALSKGRS